MRCKPYVLLYASFLSQLYAVFFTIDARIIWCAPINTTQPLRQDATSMLVMNITSSKQPGLNSKWPASRLRNDSIWPVRVGLYGQVSQMVARQCEQYLICIDACWGRDMVTTFRMLL